MRLRRYRLRPVESAAAGPPLFGYVDSLGWWASGRLWIAGWLSASPPSALRLRVEGDESVGERIAYSLPGQPGLTGIVAVVPTSLAPTTFLVREIEVEFAGHWYRWAGRRREITVCPDTCGWLADYLSRLPEPTRGSLCGFVERQLPHGGESRADERYPTREEGDRIVERTHRMLACLIESKSARRELPHPALVERDQSFGFTFEHAFLAAADRVLVSGWSFDPNHEVDSAWIVSSRSGRRRIDFGRPHTPREDVEAVYRSHFGDRALAHRRILDLVPVEVGDAKRLAQIEVRRRDGTVLICPMPSIDDDPFVGREFVRRLVSESRLPPAVLEEVAAPAHRRLHEQCRRQPAIEVFTAGDPPERPSTSLVVALGREPRHLQDQLLLLAGDRSLEDVEILFVGERSCLDDELLHQLDLSVGLYGLAFRLLLAEGPLERVGALNLGAQHACGAVVVFLDRLAAPAVSGWVSFLVEGIRADGVGLIGPRLLRDSRTLESAGLRIERFADSLEFRALGAGCPLVWQSTPAAHGFDLTGLTISRSLFERVGGLRDEDLSRTFEPLDLALRVRAEGLEIPQTAGVELMVFGAATSETSSCWHDYTGWRAYLMWSEQGLLG